MILSTYTFFYCLAGIDNTLTLSRKNVAKALTPKGLFTGRIMMGHRPLCRPGTIDIYPKYMRRVHRADGYTYQQKGVVAFPLWQEGQRYPRHGGL